KRGGALTVIGVGGLAWAYIQQADIKKKGACHIFRHTCATLMLEGGADIRYIQEMLGHEQLSTTQIYTRVYDRKLKEVHSQSHPGAQLQRRPKPTTDEDIEE